MNSNIIDFSNNSKIIIPEWMLKKESLSLMLWAGDGIHDYITDVQRLPNYDMYLCNNGDIATINKNNDYINQQPQPRCICIIDVFDSKQIELFLQLFKERFYIINSDYYGATPRLSLKYYSTLLKSNGVAYNIEGISNASFPTIDLSRILELFAPILPKELNYLRHWTLDLIKLAFYNDLPPQTIYNDSEFEKNYSFIKSDQKIFKEKQKKLYPELDSSISYSKDSIESYWDLLSSSILCVNLDNGFRWLSHPIYEWMDDQFKDGSCIIKYKERFANYLYNRIYLSNINQDDFNKYIESKSNTLENKIKALQFVIGKLSYNTNKYSLIRNIIYYNDERKVSDPEMKTYGLVIIKP